MFPFYRFSPIRDEEQFFTAIEYIATQVTALCKKITGAEYSITNLTVFSHYPDEFFDPCVDVLAYVLSAPLY